MRLKCIRLSGFKSFVDPTTVSFPSNMTAVVGPNGCGKSNIIDAVRWVLGESSAKNLRGEAMTDVIFNGSNTRKPVSQASIELVFDNSDASLLGEYASYAEISARRKVTREGQSTYYLNGSKCRRRDIIDIFLGTGLGPRSYAIIEQGMISRLIEARPDDLRVFIEEAAGISKYKERRRETENRIQRTQENLARLSDLRDELGRQLERLQRQAHAAERYQHYQTQAQQLNAQLTAMRWQVMAQQAEQLQHVLGEQETQLQAQISAQYQADAQAEQLRDQRYTLNEAFSRVQARFYAIGAEIAHTEQSIQHAQHRLRQLQDDLCDAERQQEETRAQFTQDQAMQAELDEQERQLREEQAILSEQDAHVQQLLLEAEQQQEDWQAQWQRFTLASNAPKQQMQVAQLRIEQLQHSLTSIAQHMTRLQDERTQLAETTDTAEQEQLKQQLQELLAEHERLKQQQIEHDRQRALLRNNNHSTQQAQQQVSGRLQCCQGQISALQSLQDAAFAPDDALQHWLAEQQLQKAPYLADGLRVAEGWELAVETVLGADMQALCVADWPQEFSSLQAGYVRLLKQGRLQPTSDTGQRLLDKVEHAPANLYVWLAHVHCAESLDEVWPRLAQLDEGESIITRDGYWVSQHFLRVRRGENAETGVLKRARQLEALRSEESHLDKRHHDLNEQLTQQRHQLAQLEQQSGTLRQHMQANQTQIGEYKSRLAALSARNEQVQKRQQQVSEQLQELAEQQAIDQVRLTEAELSLEQAELAVNRALEQEEQLQYQQQHVRSQLEQVRSQAQHCQQQFQDTQLQLSRVSTQKASVTQALERLQQHIERTSVRHQQLSLELLEGESPIELQRAQLEAQLQQRLLLDEELRAARNALEDVDNRLREVEKQRHQAQQQAEEIRDQSEKLRLNRHALEVQQQGLQEQLYAEGLEAHEVLMGLPAGADSDGWQAQLEQINRKIQHLGAINLAAIDEFRQQSERKLYLDAQNEDLQSALDTLENVIRKIDRETRQRFKETFDRINTGLQELFPKVFGGGMASLELTGEDLLDAGVAIMARPPGKKNSTIHLLSGGEKALTALALVFAIFQLNPAPFCMLDEVDAPLDDANVGRYVRLVKEMSAKVQFIYITHNKIAMEMADQLMGVTMQEPGCSRLVSVDLEEAAALAEQ